MIVRSDHLHNVSIGLPGSVHNTYLVRESFIRVRPGSWYDEVEKYYVSCCDALCTTIQDNDIGFRILKLTKHGRTETIKEST